MTLRDTYPWYLCLEIIFLEIAQISILINLLLKDRPAGCLIRIWADKAYPAYPYLLEDIDQ